MPSDAVQPGRTRELLLTAVAPAVGLASGLLAYWIYDLGTWWAFTLALPVILGVVAGLTRTRPLFAMLSVAVGIALHLGVVVAFEHEPGEVGWLGRSIAISFYFVILLALGLVSWLATSAIVSSRTSPSTTA